MNIKISKKIFNDIYYPYLTQYDKPLEIYYGGAGSGKSVFICQKLLIKALNDKRKVLVIRKIQSSQKESCWRLFLETLDQFHILDMCNIRVSDMTITLPNKSTFIFKGLDDSEKIKSIVGITDIWMEEATEFTEEDYEQLKLRMRAKKKDLQFFLSFNPVSRASWIYKRWFAENKYDNAFILKTTYKNNKFLPEQYIKSLEELIETSPIYYKIYVLGEFTSLNKLVYSNWKKEEIDREKLLKDEKLDLFACCGLDFGFSLDPTAFIASYLDEKNKKIYIYKEIVEKGKTNPELAELLTNEGFSKAIIVADSAEPKSIEELRQEGIRRIRASKKGPDSIIHGIQKLQQYEIIVDPSCIHVITELENYSWQKDKSGEYIQRPIDDFNHCLDALRYSLQCIAAQRRITSFDKHLLGL